MSRLIQYARGSIGNLLENWNFENSGPLNSQATTAGNVWIDGTSAGLADPYGQKYGWATVTNTSSANSAQIVSNVFHDGTRSMCLSLGVSNGQIQVQNTPGASAEQLVRNGIPAVPGTSYTMSFWIKTDNVSGAPLIGDGAFVQLLGRSTSGTLTSGVTSTPITTVSDWTLQSISFVASSTTNWLTPKLIVSALGPDRTLTMTAWFAEIYVGPTTVPARTPTPGRPSVNRTPF